MLRGDLESERGRVNFEILLRDAGQLLDEGFASLQAGLAGLNDLLERQESPPTPSGDPDPAPPVDSTPAVPVEPPPAMPPQEEPPPSTSDVAGLPLAEIPAVGGWVQPPYARTVGPVAVSSRYGVSSTSVQGSVLHVVDGAGKRTTFQRPPMFVPTEEVVVYASPAGSDGGAGTVADPVKTIRAAVRKVLGQSLGPGIQPVVVLMDAGTYEIGTTGADPAQILDRWVEIRRADGLSTPEVKVTSGKIEAMRVKYQGVTIRSMLTSGMDRGSGAWLWCDGCVLQGPGRDAGQALTWNTWDRTYFTNSVLKSCLNGGYNPYLIANCDLVDIGSDGFKTPAKTGFMMYNSRCTDLYNSLGKHADLVQWTSGPIRNVLMMDVTATGHNKSTLVGVYETATADVDGFHMVRCSFEDTARAGTSNPPFSKIEARAGRNMHAVSCSFSGTKLLLTAQSGSSPITVVDCTHVIG